VLRWNDGRIQTKGVSGTVGIEGTAHDTKISLSKQMIGHIHPAFGESRIACAASKEFGVPQKGLELESRRCTRHDDE